MSVGDEGEGEIFRKSGASRHGPDGIAEEFVVEGEAGEIGDF